MKKLAKVAGVLVALLVASGGGAYVWASSASSARLGASFEAHTVDFPIPFPLSTAEVEALRAERATQAAPDADGGVADVLAGVDLNAVALERARARGKHLVESIYPCIECHGADFGGGTMVDSPEIGRIFGLNLTTGKGGVTSGYTPADWDRMVRHGIRPDKKPTLMASGDFVSMSDHELSDIVAYIRSVPPVDKEMPRPVLGPVGMMLTATKQMPIDAEKVEHQKAHKAERPPETDTLAFGEHLTKVCTGCHGVTFVGGPIHGGPPDWAPAANITQHADGILAYTQEDFRRALREAKAKDGRTFKAPMDLMGKFGKNMSDVEIDAMFAYLKTVPPNPSPGK